MRIKRALVSVFDKKELLPFCQFLTKHGVEILSTGGTAEHLKKHNISVMDVSAVTQFPEMLDGRVKTLHPNIHAGLLAIRENIQHMDTLTKHSIGTIDIVIVNLYPFWDAVKNKTNEEEIIEMIDIGGPAMLRSASKNFRDVAAVCEPSDYKAIQDELQANAMELSLETKKRLAGKIFKLTASYDAMIADYFNSKKPVSPADVLPDALTLNFEKTADLRYGENPHQKGALYLDKSVKPFAVLGARQLHGKELSFNNILDLDAALEMAQSFSEPACSIIKHTSPCGFAVGKDAKDAFKKAHICDPLSAFGGIVGLNCIVDEKAAKAILASGFLECIIAKDFTKEALVLLQTKKNLRLLSLGKESGLERYDFKKVRGGLLLQDRNELDPAATDLKVVTKVKPNKKQIEDLLFSFKVCRYVKSNAIVIAKNKMCIGLGMGQPSRVDSCMTAFRKAGSRSKAAVLASDGFFPKSDSIALAKKAGIKAIIQPGGSIQDEEVIKACDKAGIAMVLSGVRHFKH